MSKFISLALLPILFFSPSGFAAKVNLEAPRKCEVDRESRHPNFLAAAGSVLKVANSEKVSLAQLLNGNTRITIDNLRPRNSFFYYDKVSPVAGKPLHYEIMAAGNFYFSGHTSLVVEAVDAKTADLKIYPTYSQATGTNASNADDLLIVFRCVKD